MNKRHLCAPAKKKNQIFFCKEEETFTFPKQLKMHADNQKWCHLVVVVCALCMYVWITIETTHTKHRIHSYLLKVEARTLRLMMISMAFIWNFGSLELIMCRWTESVLQWTQYVNRIHLTTARDVLPLISEIFVGFSFIERVCVRALLPSFSFIIFERHSQKPLGFFVCVRFLFLFQRTVVCTVKWRI